MNQKSLRVGGRRPSPFRSKLEERFGDEARFIRSWFDSPATTGAVSPSGRFLARAMARCVDVSRPGLIVELGPGTGPVTEALIHHGVPAERLVLVEYDASFCKLLERRFPGAHILRGDAYRLRETLKHLAGEEIAAIVSSLPLLNRPERERLTLLDEAFSMMGPRGVFVQFTYGLVSPMPLKASRRAASEYSGEVCQPVWLNIPPARVWRYRRATATDQALQITRRMVFPPALDALRQRQFAPAVALLRKFADGGRHGRR